VKDANFAAYIFLGDSPWRTLNQTQHGSGKPLEPSGYGVNECSAIFTVVCLCGDQGKGAPIIAQNGFTLKRSFAIWLKQIALP
jgi:hypothetical protein